jgi:deoxyribodipyrimidine photo-lyase
VSNAPTLLWFRQDLRLQDNPALHAALAAGGPVIPVFILDEAGEGDWPWGGAARWWWHHSLGALREDLRARRSGLVLRRGEAARLLPELVRTTGAARVYWNRRYEPDARRRDQSIKAGLRADGVEVRSFNAALLFEPHEISNKSGQPFKVFTPFWRHCLGLPVAAPVAPAATGAWPAPATWPRSDALEDWGLLPTIPWDRGLAATWEPGEAGAARQLRRFIAEGMGSYADRRNLPGVVGTSRLSPHLHYGEIGPRQIWAAVREVGAERGVFPPGKGAQVFLSEVGWREFAHHLLYHFPATASEPLRPEFQAFPWREDADGRLLRAWQRGRTGYPIVDAGMRELWATGWMHNRVRMIAGSFLVKHLRLPWQGGRAGFGTPWLMPIWPTTRWAGSGRRAAEPTRPPISASLRRCCRGASSTSRAPMCGAGCRNWLMYRTSGYTAPGRRRRPS